MLFLIGLLVFMGFTGRWRLIIKLNEVVLLLKIIHLEETWFNLPNESNWAHAWEIFWFENLINNFHIFAACLVGLFINSPKLYIQKRQRLKYKKGLINVSLVSLHWILWFFRRVRIFCICSSRNYPVIWYNLLLPISYQFGINFELWN